MMKKIDITDRVLKLRSEKKLRDQKTLESMTMPEWMQSPFDEYFEKNSSTNSSTISAENTKKDNVVKIDFSQNALEIPKALAASSVAHDKTPWYEQGVIAFKDVSGAIMNIIFNKESDSNIIDITVTVTDGDSSFLKKYCGLSDLRCSLFDKKIELASLTAAVNHNGTFMHAEGIVLESYEPNDGEDFISLRFH